MGLPNVQYDSPGEMSSCATYTYLIFSDISVTQHTVFHQGSPELWTKVNVVQEMNLGVVQ